MPDTVIDLGELTGDAPAPPSPRPLRGLAPRPSRRVLSAVVAVLAAVTLTGSVHHDPPDSAAIIPATAADLTFWGRDTYVVVTDTADPPSNQVENKIVNVYALPSATHESRTSVTVTGPILQVIAVDDLVLVSYQSDRAGNTATAAYTAGTERTVWRRYGRLLDLTPSGRHALLVEIPPGARQPRWSGVEVRSGELGWRSDNGPDGTPSLTDPVPVAYTAVVAGTTLVMTGDLRPQTLVDVSAGGRIQARDLDTGRITASVTVPAPASWRTVGLQVGAAAGMLLVSTVGRGITAYDLSDLSERWRSPLALADWLVRPACGDVICLVGYDGGLRVLDPGTGRQRWAAGSWANAERIGPYLLVTPSQMNQSTVPPLTVLDVATGRARGTVSGWRLAGRTRAGAVPVVREDARLPRAYFGMLDPGTSTVRVLGVAEQVAGECGIAAGVMVCRRIDSSFGVWHVDTR